MRLRVSLGDLRVGDLSSGYSGAWEFRFDDAYASMRERPVLGRWFEDQDLGALRYRAPQGWLPAFFENYLPEPGSALRALLARSAGVEPTRQGPLLAALGRDLPGAVVVQEVNEGDGEDSAPPVDAPARRDRPLRFSLAGMQLKFSVAREAERFTLPVTGVGGRWIAKLPDRSYPSVPRHECAMLSLARGAGVDVPEVSLVPWREIEGLPRELTFDEPDAMVIRRYDRSPDGARIHQEDFAQVFDRRPDDKYDELKTSRLRAAYDSIGVVVRAVCGQADFEEYLRRLVLMVLTGNHDAHLKNWSLYYPDPRRARLAPAYDLLSTVAYLPEVETMALRLYKRTRFDEVLRSDFERLAEKAGADASASMSVVDETIERFREAWSAEGASLPEGHKARIDVHLGSLSLLKR